MNKQKKQKQTNPEPCFGATWWMVGDWIQKGFYFKLWVFLNIESQSLLKILAAITIEITALTLPSVSKNLYFDWEVCHGIVLTSTEDNSVHNIFSYVIIVSYPATKWGERRTSAVLCTQSVLLFWISKVVTSLYLTLPASEYQFQIS